MATQVSQLRPPRFPILALLHPREHTRFVVATLAVGLAVWGAIVGLLRLPVWVASTTVVALLLAPGALKWRADHRRYGGVVMVLSVLLAAQGFHSVEHAVQEIQYHILHWPPFASSGLISAANAEWVHFVWNWAVVLTIAYLVRGGMRNAWAWLLLAWSLAHAIEHAYMMFRYLEVVQQLRQFGFADVSAQGLPGILGRGGWLARSDVTQGTFLCRLPGLTTAPRIDVHFWWNAGEIALLLLAAHTFLRRSLALIADHGARTVGEGRLEATA
jgi:hypothetical protein